MPYRFAKERPNHTDYASGRVFYGWPGHAAFPVRLTSEIFQRCMAVRKADGITDPCILYDPCCGGAYHLSTLAFLHWSAIDKIIGSDADKEVLSLAERNLALLTVEGLNQRAAEISEMLESFGKPSHAAALESAKTLKGQLLGLVKTHEVKTRVFHADATDGEALREQLHCQVDIVITDVPHGRLSLWQDPAHSQASALSPIWRMLEALRQVLSLNSVVAVAANKQQKVSHEAYQRVDRFRIGKRQVVLLQPTRVQRTALPLA